MKKLLVSTFMLALATISISQTDMLSKINPQKEVDNLAKELNLNEDQKAKTLKVITDASTKLEALKAKKEAPAAEATDAKQINDNKTTALKGIFTADQFKKYSAMASPELKKPSMDNIKKMF